LAGFQYDLKIIIQKLLTVYRAVVYIQLDRKPVMPLLVSLR